MLITYNKVNVKIAAALSLEAHSAAIIEYGS